MPDEQKAETPKTPQTPAATEADTSSAFDDAFAEFAKARSEPEPHAEPQEARTEFTDEDGLKPASPPAANDPGLARDARDNADPSHAEKAATDDTDKSTPAEAREDETDAPEAADEGEDIWKGATEAQRAAFEAAEKRLADAEQKIRSDAGRVSALQKRLNELTAGKPPAPQAPGGTANDNAAEDDADEPPILQREGFRRMAEDFPEIGAPFAEIVREQQKAIDALKADLGRRRAMDEEAYLDQQHPDWREQAQRDEFGEWVNSLPPFMRQAFDRNSEQITDATEASTLIALFKQAHPTASAPSQAANDDAPAEADPNTQIAAQRRQRLKSGTTVTNKGTGPTDTPSDDFESAFKFHAAKQNQRRAAAAGR